MQKNTKGRGLLGGALVTLCVAVVSVVLAGMLLIDYFGQGNSQGFETITVLLCAVLFLAVAAGVIVALVQRWRELQGGEEDEAKRY